VASRRFPWLADDSAGQAAPGAPAGPALPDQAPAGAATAPGRELMAAEAELLERALTALHAVYEVPRGPERPSQGCTC